MLVGSSPAMKDAWGAVRRPGRHFLLRLLLGEAGIDPAVTFSHQRGQAFQLRISRQTATETRSTRNRRLQHLAAQGVEQYSPEVIVTLGTTRCGLIGSSPS
jgi:hypothetical protein